MASSASDKLLNAGYAEMHGGRLDRAEWNFRKLLQREPRHHEALHQLGLIAHQTGRSELAIELINQSIALNPKFSKYHYNLGLVFHQLAKFQQAAESYRRAIELDPNDPLPLNNLGNVLRELGLLEDAVVSFRAALKLRPNYAGAMSNLATALQRQARLDEAIELYRSALALEPNFALAHSNLLLCMNYHGGIDPQEVFAEHRRWAERHAGPLTRAAPPLPAITPRSASEKLRIGYVSADFRQHPVAYFIRPVLEHHDRERFSVTCYSSTTNPDAVTQQLRNFVETWRDVASLTDEQLAARIRADRIDILIDLGGHTGHHRLLVFARRPAPIQMTWIGYPNTTGMLAMDYRITDDIADPPGMTESFHTEKLLRLPDGFLCYQPPLAEMPAVATSPPVEQAGHVTFVSFNNFAKVTPAVIAAWARILRELTDSRLMLKAKGLSDQATQTRTREHFASHGIDAAARIEITAQQGSFREHLGQYNRADVALDTFPYNGTTTTCEALLMGAPVVTLAGRTHAARVGASLLHRVDLDELVADSEDAYVSTAVALARDIPRLRTLRTQLRDRLLRSPLTDAVKFTRSFECEIDRAWLSLVPPPGTPGEG